MTYLNYTLPRAIPSPSRLDVPPANLPHPLADHQIHYQVRGMLEYPPENTLFDIAVTAFPVVSKHQYDTKF